MTALIVDFARDELGFELHPVQASILNEVYEEGIRTAVLRLGRRSGKGRISAVVATFEATVNADAHLAAAPPGEELAIVVISSTERQARVVQRYIRGFLQRPGLAALVARETRDTIELRNGITIITLPCHAAAVRGYAVPVALADEVAWFQGRDGSPLDAKEIMDAIRPATLQFPERRLILMSTPRWPSGYWYDLCERAASGRVATMRHWHYSTAEVNPSIPAAELEEERLADPQSFAREYMAEFVSGVGAALAPELVRAAVEQGRGDLAPQPGVRYVIALDPAYTGDRFAAIVGHRRPDGRVVVDRVTSWKGSKAAPVQIDPTLDEIAGLAAAYNGARVLTDQYSSQTIIQGLDKRGVRVEAAPWTNDSKVSALGALRRVLYGSALELPDHRELITELTNLEQRPTPSGRPRIAAPPGSHDDFATCLLQLVADLAAGATVAAGGSVAPGETRDGANPYQSDSVGRLGLRGPRRLRHASAGLRAHVRYDG